MISFSQAKLEVILFGEYKGSTIDQVSKDDKGLLYLDWLVGQSWLNERYPDLKRALEIFLKEPSIAREINNIVGE